MLRNRCQLPKHKTCQYRATNTEYVGIGDTRKEARAGERFCGACLRNFLRMMKARRGVATLALQGKDQISILAPRLFRLFIGIRANGSKSSVMSRSITRSYHQAVATARRISSSCQPNSSGVTPRNRYHEDPSEPAEIRTISILGDAPPSASYTLKHAHDAGGINHE
jgi:hypothetical protein